MSSSVRPRAQARVLRGCNAASAIDVLPQLHTIPVPTAYDAEVGGNDAVSAARREAAMEEARTAGFDAGYQDGFTRGQADGAAAAARTLADDRAALLDAAQILRTAAETAERMYETTLATVEDRLVGAAFTLAEAILQRELALSASPGRDAIARALSVAPARGALEARLHPDDAAALDDVGDLALGRDLQVVADPAVAPGDCVLHAGATDIDASIAAALARVRTVLAPHVVADEPEPEFDVDLTCPLGGAA
ncbi:MAG: FliH/SctL family protein [Acidimicrobiia bacterium]